MNNFKENKKNLENVENIIFEYIRSSSGLEYEVKKDHILEVIQVMDKKSIHINLSEVREVLKRCDQMGNVFIQINFNSGKKVIITNNLIGFKPFSIEGLDMSKLPKVVTSPDLMSVLDAIQEVIEVEDQEVGEEIDLLKKVYFAIIKGGEEVGFDFVEEKKWLDRIISTKVVATA